MHHHHHHFGHHHHHFGHHHHHHGHHFGHHRHGFGNPSLGALAVGATAGLAAGALVGTALARPSTRVGYRDQVMPAPPVIVAPVVPFTLTNPPPVAQQMPLGVDSIRLQCGSVDHGVQYFAIDVFPSNGGNPWRVMRRYNQFYDLSQALNAYRNIITPFPRKHLTGCHGSKLEERRRGLESWLSSVIAASPSVPSWHFLLKNFLEIPANGITTTPVAYSQPSPVPVAESVPLPVVESTPLPAAPPVEMPPQRVENHASQGEGMIMDITVPPGVSPGQMLDVALPSGQQILMEIPQGTVAGQVLEVWYDPVQNTLRPLM